VSSDGFTVAILGVGLIGGSLGMAWRRAGVARRIIGIDRGTLDEALRLGAINEAAVDAEAAVRVADVVVLAAPVGAIIQMAQRFGPLVKPGAVVTDVGSTKAAVVQAWEEHLAEGAAFVGGHPLFGREVSGVCGASPDLPAGCRWVLTPGLRSTPAAVAAVTRLAEAAGAVVRVMTPAEHDARVAYSSHLPQLAATALAAAASGAEAALGGVLDLTAGGFRDTTRIAASPAGLWQEIFATNTEAIRAALAEYRALLDQLDAALATDDQAVIERIFAVAHATRRGR
jgi:prephenate dehydrogenase